MAIQERDPRAYELMTVFIPDLTDEDSQAEIEKIESLVTANGGTMTETLTASPWGRRRLAYTIRFNGVDYRDGIYTVFHFDMAPSALTELEREMKLDTSLMRYLLVHDDPKTHEKAPHEDGTEDTEGESAPTTEVAGTAAGGATAAAASQVTAASAPESDEAASADVETTEAVESQAPASETSEPAAAASAPVEEAPATDTTTDTAPPAADEASSDDDKE